jgi:hypothetical protein
VPVEVARLTTGDIPGELSLFGQVERSAVRRTRSKSVFLSCSRSSGFWRFSRFYRFERILADSLNPLRLLALGRESRSVRVPLPPRASTFHSQRFAELAFWGCACFFP